MTHHSALKTNPVLAGYHAEHVARQQRKREAVQRHRNRLFSTPKTKPVEVPASLYQPRECNAHVQSHYAYLRMRDAAECAEVAKTAVTAIALKSAFLTVCPHNRMDLFSMRRTRDVVRWRMALMHLLKKHTTLTLPQIGRSVGGKDHTTVLHAVRKVDAAIEAGTATPITLSTGHIAYLRTR